MKHLFSCKKQNIEQKKKRVRFGYYYQIFSSFLTFSSQLCISALLFATAYAGSAKKDSEAKAVPLEKKLDKRGLLNLGYGYGINGLDVGYLGGGHLGGVHGLNLGHSSPAWGGYSSGLGGLGLSHGYGGQGLSLGGHGYGGQGLALGGHGLGGHGLGGHGLGGHGLGSHGYGGHGLLLGGHTESQRTVTLVKGVPVPYPVEKHIPYPVERHIPYPGKNIPCNN